MPRRLPRLVVSDLDGTLLSPDGLVTHRTRKALELAEERGATIVFATGRPIRWVRPIGEQTGHRGLAICSNGAVVYDLHEDRIIESFPLPPDVGRAIVEAVGDALPGAVFGVELGESFRHEAEYPVNDDYGDLTKVPRSALFDEVTAVKLLIRDREFDSDSLLAKVREAAGEIAEFTHSGGRGLLEISMYGVTKASTLARVCEERGIEAADVAAFGDMPNDLAMLTWAGTSYAMANGHPAVVAAADHLSPPNSEDGVATVLESIFA